MNSVSLFGLPTTSKNMSQDCRIPGDDETNFDIFDFNIGSDDDVANSGKLYEEKDELTMNGDLVNKYEKSLGLDIVKDKNVCWAAGNFDSEICPLKSYDKSNENSLLSFCKENLDSESSQSFSHEWTFDENIPTVSNENLADLQTVVPKKTGDITKIKGWRRKQFTLTEKNKDNKTVLKKGLKKLNAKQHYNEKVSSDFEKPSQQNGQTNKDCAFVCDELDDFLDQEAELKINYEIPHLSAECGIKLTSEDLVSRPKIVTETIMPRRSKNNWKKGMKPAKNTNILLPYQTNGKSALLNKLKGQRKPIAKKENKPRLEVEPCRRSVRLQQGVSNKPNIETESFIKKRPNVKGEKINKYHGTLKPTTAKQILNFDPNYNLTVRKFGMVLYPGPGAPLNQFVRYHLQKIRRYRTYIDKRWATFAATALAVKAESEKRSRMILPVTCCFKYKIEPELHKTEEKLNHTKRTIVGVDAVNEYAREKDVRETIESLVNIVCANEERERDVERDISMDHTVSETVSNTGLCVESIAKDLYHEDGDHDADIGRVEDLDIQNSECQEVVIPYDSDDCDIPHENKRLGKIIADTSCDGVFPHKSDIRSSISKCSNKTFVNRRLNKLLAKKLNELKLCQQMDNNTNGIDKLKLIRPSAIELIKLDIIKKNFYTGYINLWYCNAPKSRSKVFLTFSVNPPVLGAVNLKMINRLTVLNIPAIVTTIIDEDLGFDSNDFAILYCDGKYWEIHGTLNFTMDEGEADKSDEKIQVFHLTRKDLPELEMLSMIKRKEEKNRVLKWWVMHHVEDYTEVNIKVGDEVGRVSRSVIVKTWRSRIPSFIEFKGLFACRPMGIAINPNLWPYFLIGPYFLSDDHGLVLKKKSAVIPFEYSLPLDRVKPNCLLKRFISSVVMHSWRHCRKVVGMWLYDTTGLRLSNYIEIRTKVRKSGHYHPTIEHDYSLSRTQDGLVEARVDEVKKIKEFAREKFSEPQQVYLSPSVPSLGYLKGEVHPDGSIVIEHPLKTGRKIRSHAIGDWLNKMMKRRIKFIPGDLKVEWKIIKNANLLTNRAPLDKFSLGRTHILCQKGLYNLLYLTPEKINALGLNLSVIMSAIDENPIIQEVLSLKELGKILLNTDTCVLEMSEVLERASAEIEHLEMEQNKLKAMRISKELERTELCRKYLRILGDSCMDTGTKRAIRLYINRLLRNVPSERSSIENGVEKVNFQYVNAVNTILHNYLEYLSHDDGEDEEKSSAVDSTPLVSDSTEISAQKESAEEKKWDDDMVRQLEVKINNLYELLKMSTADSSVHEDLKKRLNKLSEILNKIKSHSDATDRQVTEDSVKQTEFSSETEVKAENSEALGHWGKKALNLDNLTQSVASDVHDLCEKIIQPNEPSPALSGSDIKLIIKVHSKSKAKGNKNKGILGRTKSIAKTKRSWDIRKKYARIMQKKRLNIIKNSYITILQKESDESKLNPDSKASLKRTLSSRSIPEGVNRGKIRKCNNSDRLRKEETYVIKTKETSSPYL